mmetsp:Transcript_12117/g.35418  ORF Transcript_12117/g.35418 Transcript_12117/m.35418 type:complete len:98 (-) Transcript_12117:547-840(-)
MREDIIAHVLSAHEKLGRQDDLALGGRHCLDLSFHNMQTFDAVSFWAMIRSSSTGLLFFFFSHEGRQWLNLVGSLMLSLIIERFVVVCEWGQVGVDV